MQNRFQNEECSSARASSGPIESADSDLLRYLSGEMTAEEISAFEARLIGDEGLCAELAATVQLSQSLAAALCEERAAGTTGALPAGLVHRGGEITGSSARRGFCDSRHARRVLSGMVCAGLLVLGGWLGSQWPRVFPPANSRFEPAGSLTSLEPPPSNVSDRVASASAPSVAEASSEPVDSKFITAWIDLRRTEAVSADEPDGLLELIVFDDSSERIGGESGVFVDDVDSAEAFAEVEVPKWLLTALQAQTLRNGATEEQIP